MDSEAWIAEMNFLEEQYKRPASEMEQVLFCAPGMAQVPTVLLFYNTVQTSRPQLRLRSADEIKPTVNYIFYGHGHDISLGGCLPYLLSIDTCSAARP